MTGLKLSSADCAELRDFAPDGFISLRDAFSFFLRRYPIDDASTAYLQIMKTALASGKIFTYRIEYGMTIRVPPAAWRLAFDRPDTNKLFISAVVRGARIYRIPRSLNAYEHFDNEEWPKHLRPSGMVVGEFVKPEEINRLFSEENLIMDTKTDARCKGQDVWEAFNDIAIEWISKHGPTGERGHVAAALRWIEGEMHGRGFEDDAVPKDNPNTRKRFGEIAASFG